MSNGFGFLRYLCTLGVLLAGGLLPFCASDAGGGETPPPLVGPAPLRDNPPIDLRRVVHPGEKLIYIAKWSGFPGGYITTRVWPRMRTFDGRPVFMFEMTMETNDFLSVFYPVRTHIRSLADAELGWSYLFRRRVHEGEYTGNDRVLFEYNHLDEIGKLQPLARPALIRGDRVEELEPRSIPGHLCDPLALGWYLRAIPLEERGDMAAALIGDRFTTGVVSFSVTGRERIGIPGIGSFDCVVIRPQATTYDGKESLIKVDGVARFWLERHTRILLRAEADIPVGRVGVTLMAHEHTELAKYATPLSAEAAK